jgi:hypothetical protein
MRFLMNDCCFVRVVDLYTTRTKTCWAGLPSGFLSPRSYIKGAANRTTATRVCVLSAQKFQHEVP